VVKKNFQKKAKNIWWE